MPEVIKLLLINSNTNSDKVSNILILYTAKWRRNMQRIPEAIKPLSVDSDINLDTSPDTQIIHITIRNPNRGKKEKGFRWIHKSMHGNVTNSVSENKYKTKFDNGTTKELHSSLLYVGNSSSSLLLLKAVTILVELIDGNNIKQASKANNDPDIEEDKSIIF